MYTAQHKKANFTYQYSSKVALVILTACLVRLILTENKLFILAAIQKLKKRKEKKKKLFLAFE